MAATLRTLLVFIPLVTMYTIVCGAVSIVLAAIFRSGEPSHRVARFWADLILRTCRVKVSIKGLEHLEPGKHYVFASNHQSLFDIPILFARLPISFRILYKQSLHRIPFLGWHLYLSGHIPVDRANPARARRSLERAAERTRVGKSVVVFPEGTRSWDGVVGRFKHGSFNLAVKSGVPIIPVTISESWHVMRRSELTVRPATVRVCLDRPLPVEGLGEEAVSDLTRTVRDVVARNYHSAAAPAVNEGSS